LCFQGFNEVMVSATDYPSKSGVHGSHEAASGRPRKPRFRLLAALAAPFKDVDERAVRKKGPQGPVRNNSKGNVFITGAAAPAKVPVRRF